MYGRIRCRMAAFPENSAAYSGIEKGLRLSGFLSGFLFTCKGFVLCAGILCAALLWPGKTG